MQPKRLVRVRSLERLKSYVGRLLLRRLGRRLSGRGYPAMAVVAHDTIGDDIVLLGRYEDDLLTALTAKVIPAAVPDHAGATVLDVGANIGNHTLAFAPLFERVFAFEPNPIALHLIEANLLLNDVHNVTVCPVGLGARAETRPFSMRRGNLGAGHFVAAVDATPPSSRSLEVAVGDHYLPPRMRPSERVGLVKIDVEGAEAAVLAGLKTLISEQRPLVLFEALDRESAERTSAELRRMGLEFFFAIEPLRIYRLPEVLRVLARFVWGAGLYLKRIEEFEDRDYSLILACWSDEWVNTLA